MARYPASPERRQLVAPRVPELGEAVAQDDGWPVGRAGGDHMELDPVRRDLLVPEGGPQGSQALADLLAFSSWCF